MRLDLGGIAKGYAADEVAAILLSRNAPQRVDEMVRDLVAYLTYMGEPASVKRVRVGIVVLLFLGLLVVMTWLLKREYWKDVH